MAKPITELAHRDRFIKVISGLYWLNALPVHCQDRFIKTLKNHLFFNGFCNGADLGPFGGRLGVDLGSIGGRFRTDFVIFYVYIRILTYLGPSLDLFGSGLGP